MVRQFTSSVLLVLISVPVSAGTTRVHFDIAPTASCADVTTAEFARANPNYRLVKTTVRVSAMVRQPQDHNEYFIQFVSPTGSLQIVDFSPKTRLASRHAGNIGVDTKNEHTRSLGVNLSGSFEHLVRATGVGDLGTKDSVQYHYELKPPQTTVLTAGTLDRGTGVYFKMRQSVDMKLEGTHHFELVLRVPQSWRADWMLVRCEARDIAGSKPHVLSTARFVLGLYAGGDDEALAAAEQLVRAESTLRQVAAANRAEIRRAATPTVVHRLGVMLDVYQPPIPDDWLDRVIYGPVGGIRDRIARRLPDNVERRVLDYVRAKQKIYQLSGQHLLVMASNRRPKW